jgi:putative chitinase
MLTNDQIAKATKSNAADVALYATLIQTDLMLQGVSDPRAIAGALATIGVENHFKSVREYGSINDFKKYEFRKDLGNDNAGDGYKYRGGGLCQLTGKANYAKYSKIAGVDLIAFPDKILNPIIGSKVFAAYFREKGLDVHSIRGNWRHVRQSYNGGNNGISDFYQYVFNLLDLFYQ